METITRRADGSLTKSDYELVLNWTFTPSSATSYEEMAAGLLELALDRSKMICWSFTRTIDRLNAKPCAPTALTLVSARTLRAAIAQLVRALDCGSRGPPFEPGWRYQ